jgi:plastocyanin
MKKVYSRGLLAVRMTVLAGLTYLSGATSAVAAEEYGSAAKPIATLPAAEPGVREFYIATVHLDGKTSEKGDGVHPPEAYPKQALAGGGGLILTPPDATGTWNMRAFVFQPANFVAFAGDRIVLHFVGVQGAKHRIAIDGVPTVVEVARGTLASAEIPNAKAGIIRFVSLDRQPSMRGEIVVLPKR